MHMIGDYFVGKFCSLMIGSYVGFTIRKEQWRSVIRRWWLRSVRRTPQVTWFHQTSARVLTTASRNGLMISRTSSCLIPRCKMTLLSLSFCISRNSPHRSKTRRSKSRSWNGVLVIRGEVTKSIKVELEAFSEYLATAHEGTRCRILTRKPSLGPTVTELVSTCWSDSSARFDFCVCYKCLKISKWKQRNCTSNSDHYKSYIYIFIIINEHELILLWWWNNVHFFPPK